MKHILLILFLVCSIGAYSQIEEKLTGVWLKVPSKKKGLKFMKNGDFEPYKPKGLNIKKSSFNVKYKILILDDIQYIIFSYYKEGKLLLEEKNKYKIENGKLYLSKEYEKQTIASYTDVYVRLKNH